MMGHSALGLLGISGLIGVVGFVLAIVAHRRARPVGAESAAEAVMPLLSRIPLESLRGHVRAAFDMLEELAANHRPIGQLKGLDFSADANGPWVAETTAALCARLRAVCSAPTVDHRTHAICIYQLALVAYGLREGFDRSGVERIDRFIERLATDHPPGWLIYRIAPGETFNPRLHLPLRSLVMRSSARFRVEKVFGLYVETPESTLHAPVYIHEPDDGAHAGEAKP